MGERKGVNKYYPPDFDPAKHGSINGYRKSHPLRERARKLSQGILIIRFEMPYNIWCDGCKNHIGMGVRYNAEKKKVGNYYTTPIYRFRMKCHLCDNYIEIQTDPASCDYAIVSGAQRKEERWDMKDNQQILTTEHEEKKKLETDAMFRLEHGSEDQQKLKRAIPTLSSIQEAQSAWKDDFALNSMLRRKFREEKKILKEEEERDQALLSKASVSVPLVKECEEDRRLAALLTYRSLDSYEDKQKLKRSEISNRSWFPATSRSDALKKLDLGLKAMPKPPPSSSSSASQLGIIRRRARDQGTSTCLEQATRLVHPGSPGLWAGPVPESLGADDAPGREEPAPLEGFPSSLVADYMDSSSDSEAS
ncbi:coiled-coil domain-containing protein 130 [Rhinatrema bivittatum]|uniref:coiled-coil domain-containing protein 130 n=1 Tax=Rhinatrema bivittatum TaxID=194408 RepID=UPI00112A0381|nr:coiled-coil domain-containing protein 130 [Rhinatrema bivittatum]XP_029440987.1 coiled-coil domain-containing protein 130 [Rhinatrema bivittatum]XP_029440988.1 coiled-coil domain-containing protein 130 [Rhinatrema bivittatum]